MRRLLFPLVVALVLLSLAPERALAQGSPAPEFSPAHEQEVLRALCGPVTRGSAIRLGEKVQGFLDEKGGTLYEPLLSETYVPQATVPQATPRHVYVLGAHDLFEGEIDKPQAEPTILHVALLEWKGGTWAIVAKGTEEMAGGNDGQAPTVTLRRVGASRHALHAVSEWVGMGYTMSIVALFELAPGLPELLRTVRDGSDCGLDRDGGCFTFDGTLTIDTTSVADPYDLTLSVKGTYRNEAGKVVRMPTRSMVLHFTDGKYDLRSAPAAVTSAWWGINHVMR